MTLTQTKYLLDSLPPHAIEAEMCLLGSIFIKPSVMDEVSQIIAPDDFYKPCNEHIYSAMRAYYNKHQALDVVIIHQTLIDKNLLEVVGGQEYLLELANSTPTAHNAVHYARQVRSKGILRRLIELAGTILEQAYEGKTSRPDQIIEHAEASLFALQQQEQATEIVRIDESFSSALESLNPNLPDIGIINTGFQALDDMVRLRPAEYIIIGARPSMGKTALALAMAMNIAKDNKAVGFFSVEMGIRQLAFRVLSAESGVASHSISNARYLGEVNRDRLTDAAGDLMPTELYIDESASLTVAQLRSRARRMVSQYQIKILFIDYLQLIKSGQRIQSRYVEVGMISHSLKALSKELDIPVVCLSQLNRASELRKDHKPTMSDLRESGDIEQDADVVMLLHREDYYHKEDTSYTPTNTADLIVAKQRNGPTGAITLTWIAQLMKFETYGDPTLHGECPI